MDHGLIYVERWLHYTSHKTSTAGTRGGSHNKVVATIKRQVSQYYSIIIHTNLTIFVLLLAVPMMKPMKFLSSQLTMLLGKTIYMDLKRSPHQATLHTDTSRSQNRRMTKNEEEREK